MGRIIDNGNIKNQLIEQLNIDITDEFIDVMAEFIENIFKLDSKNSGFWLDEKSYYIFKHIGKEQLLGG